MNMASKLSTGRLVDDEGDAYATIKWINIIFLPFNRVFELIILCCTILKVALGPVGAVHPFTTCPNSTLPDFMEPVKFVYLYIVDPVYIIDTFLHVVHRQVTDEAMKREHLPKPAISLIMDIFALVPLFKMAADEACPDVHIWPNILAYNEFFLIYRVVQYFLLLSTHSYLKFFFGFTIIVVLVMNFMSSLILMLTYDGLCGNCTKGLHDWRTPLRKRFPEVYEGPSQAYFLGAVFSTIAFFADLIEPIKPYTYSEFIIFLCCIFFGYVWRTFIFAPKMFAESVLRLRRIASFHSRVTRIIEETERRNPSRIAYIGVNAFYTLIWEKRRGITYLPSFVHDLPRYLRMEIKQDLAWSVFYHSPTLRDTSPQYKKWLSEYIKLDYKLPGERFFTGSHCYTHLYYIKSGIVQFICADDSTSPILSLTGGSLFGDVSFLLPPMGRKVMLRCLTYCEVFIIRRSHLLRSLYKFPEDRKTIVTLVKERLKHAQQLYQCKESIRGKDRSVDEGIAWIKKRWWEISDVLTRWKKSKKQETKCELPADAEKYHCSKYIGQLVLCDEVQLRRNTMFAKVTFPWVLFPDSTFSVIWHRVVLCTVYLVLILYPPNLSRKRIPVWFNFFKFCVDLIYMLDILVSLMTSLERKENKVPSFRSVILARCKTVLFLLDILSTAWIENCVNLMGVTHLHRPCQYNRLIKVYIIFYNKFTSEWHLRLHPIANVVVLIILMEFCFVYISSYFIYTLNELLPDMSMEYFFGKRICSHSKAGCNQDEKSVLSIVGAWIIGNIFFNDRAKTRFDLVLKAVITFVSLSLEMCIRCCFIACVYLKEQVMTNYHLFVASTKSHFIFHKIHPDLLKRMDRYLTCHWKYYQGMDVMHPNLLKGEPHDIYYRFHGAIAERLISNSKVFLNAESSLVRELAQAAKFMILPKLSTLYVFGVQCKNVTWVVNGVVKCEYHTADGDLVERFYTPTEILSVSAVFFNKVSLKTFIADTECEILYIPIHDFFTIIKRHQFDCSCIELSVNELTPRFNKMFVSYVRKNKDYQRKVRDRVFHAKQDKLNVDTNTEDKSVFVTSESLFLEEPETKFMKYWLLFRMITVILTILTTAIQAGSGARVKWQLMLVDAFCNAVSFLDIVLKLFLPYYDERGLLITNIRKCMWHYLARGFLMDLIAFLPVVDVLHLFLSSPMSDNFAAIVNIISNFATLYLLTGYFDYLTDVPTVYVTYLKILKWQIVVLLLCVASASHFVELCINFHWDEQGVLQAMERTNNCWIPPYLNLDENPTQDQLHMVFSQALYLTQCGLMRVFLGLYKVKNEINEVTIVFLGLGLISWFIKCYCLALIVLNSRGSTIFQHDIGQLIAFLKGERVENAVTEDVVNHFTYVWRRTKGLNVQSLMTERLGVVFGQDLNYYFYKRTFQALDSLLEGGESLQRQLSNVVSQTYFLSGADLVREMDVVPLVHVVHRGSVVVSRNGRKLAVLTKGGIFGPLDTGNIRPIRITARALEHTDLLEIPIKQFQELLTAEVKEKITQNLESANDYMSMKHFVAESPFNTVQYLLRGIKTIKLPWMQIPIDIQNNIWYARWLYFMWLWSTTFSILVSLCLFSLSSKAQGIFSYISTGIDVIYFVNWISEFYTMELKVNDNKCEYEFIRWRRFTVAGFYLDIASVLIPLVGTVLHRWELHIARLLRLYLFWEFYHHYCENFQNKYALVLMKFAIILILIHAMTCGWIYFACTDPYPEPDFAISQVTNTTLDYSQWTLSHSRGKGCARMRVSVVDWGLKRSELKIFYLVPTDWEIDYFVALLYIAYMFTSTSIDIIYPVNLSQSYYRVGITIVLYVLEMWIVSFAISVVYTKFRELYQYDYHVGNMLTYLKHNHISAKLLKSVLKYTRLLWQRQQGTWLPAMAKEAPLCLREDLFISLYGHHLENPPQFRRLPKYFKRQLACRLRRIMIFPGKTIVQAGDVWPNMYFIHEGEVEKWYTDSHGDKRLTSVLTQNGYFGVVPGVLCNAPYMFTYYTRTVVDMVFLSHPDWADLLASYPDIKDQLFAHCSVHRKQTTLKKTIDNN